MFEGADRCGKSTQTRLLVDALAARGTDARLQRFPDRSTAIGSMIDKYLKCEAELDDRAVHLLFAANRWEISGALAAKVRAGDTVVCDRCARCVLVCARARRCPRARSRASRRARDAKVRILGRR